MAKKSEQTPEERIKEFDQALIKLQDSYSVQLYAVLQALEGGEVHPIIKIRDTKYENKS